MTQPADRTPLRMLRHDRSILHERVAPGTARRVTGFVRPYRRVLALYALIVLADAAVVAFGPLLFRTIIDTAIPAHRTGLIAALAGCLAALAVADAGLTLVQRVIVARVGEGLVSDLRTRLFDHVQAMPLAFFTRTRTGSLVSRLNIDVIGAQTAFTDLLSNVVGGLVFVVIVVAVMATLSWPITLLAVLVLPVLAIPVRLVGRRLAALTRERYAQSGAMTQLMTERFTVGGALLVKLFGDPQQESRRFAARTGRIRDLGVEIAVIGRFFGVALALAGALATALVYGVGGIASVHGSLRLGTVVALAAYLARLYGPLSALAGAPVDVMTALVSFDRVFEILDLDPEIREAPDAATSPRGPATLAFHDVSFGYDDPLVLHHVDFDIAPGALVALVGPSGAGKTTIAMLAARLYDVTSGAVRLDGTDVRALTTRSLRARVGMVTQDPHLFHDTVRANLRYGSPDADDDALAAALQNACVADVVAALPDGLDTVVGERGYRLSGGEKQRLAIARLLLRAPDVVILDEATAHLDTVSEWAVHQALQQVLVGRTSLVIAHRLSTVRRADLVLVVDGGRIVERGTHEELVERDGLFARLYRTQFLQDPVAQVVP